MHDDFAVEPVRGLPEVPPEGEHILWQGRPDWWALTRAALGFWWVMGYFAFLTLWRFFTVIDQMTFAQAVGASVPFVILGAVVAALLILTAWIQARCTVYTITNRRVAMRIGAALTVTLNIPYTQIGSAGLDLRRDGTGTIAFATLGDTRLSYLVCWPHVRPWRFRTQPALRCIPDARRVSQLLAVQAEERVGLAEDGPLVARAAVAAE